MFLALLRKFNIPSIIIFIISIIMVLINQYFIINKPIITNEYLVYFLNLLIPLNDWSCFPFLTWFFFPSFGLVFGELLIRCNNKKKLYGLLLPISLIGILYVYFQFYRYYPLYAENYYFGSNFYYMGIKNVFLTLCFVIFALAFWYFISEFIPNRFSKALSFMGKNLTILYVFSWIFISILIHVDSIFNITYNSLSLIILTIVILIGCYISALGYLRIKK